jgi:hypothetical protein
MALPFIKPWTAEQSERRDAESQMRLFTANSWELSHYGVSGGRADPMMIFFRGARLSATLAAS